MRLAVSGSAALVLLLVASAGGAAQWQRPGQQPPGRRGGSREGDRCVAPDGRAGVCRVIYQCPEMFALLEGTVTQENLYLLNQARCGFQGTAPVVCCASSTPPPSNPFPSPPRPGGGGSGSSGGGSGGGSGGSSGIGANVPPRDVSNHPNLRILPQQICGPQGADRIVGGNVSDIFAHPWIARLGYKKNTRPNDPLTYNCGGTLVSERYVLTAAHCVVRRSSRVTSVKLGEHTIDTVYDCRKNGACLPLPIDVDVEQVIPHPEYEPKTSYNDIALLRLARRVDFQREEFVRPVCLPVGPANQNLRLDGIPLLVAGWGTTEAYEGSQVLLNVFIPAVSLETCKDIYSKIPPHRVITPQQLCAGGEKGRDSCTGDSGGPLTHDVPVSGEAKTVQFGVVSFGPRRCGTDGVPGVYTRIAYYMQWILDTMRP